MTFQKWSEIKKRKLSEEKILEIEAQVVQELLWIERRNLILCLKLKPNRLDANKAT